jgi:hypothetical protein
MRNLFWMKTLAVMFAGCSAIPEVTHQPQYHNPFPQLSRVAVLPFYNQSADPTIDQDGIALAYYNELQQIPGFEVMPVGVAKTLMMNSGLEPQTAEDFQKLAQYLQVDAVIAGSVTEFSPYYPPRIGLSVRWFAANPGFHPIPPGYGLPWGTSQEEFIPEELVFEAEFALAQEQLKTQTPIAGPVAPPVIEGAVGQGLEASADQRAEEVPQDADGSGQVALSAQSEIIASSEGAALPPDWPDPGGLIPPPPSPTRPPLYAQNEPIIRHTRLYHGSDTEFTQRLASYVYFRDEARFGGWQGYLQRSDDFIRFCCYLHITETLAARGGAGKTRVVWRWPFGRYEP